jgi:hypothetical protein
MRVLTVDYFIEGKKGTKWVPWGGTHHTNLTKAKKQFCWIKKYFPKMKLRLVQQKFTVVA